MNATGSTQGILPAPDSRRAGDFVFVSSIYPVDDSGHLVHPDSIGPYVGESAMAVQSRRVLEVLKQVLDSSGSALESTLKAEVYLVDAADFYEFKLVWREFFPDSPPARTTAVIGEDHIIPGCRLNLHAVALANDASVEREVINAPGVPDSMEAEHAPHAIKAVPFVFPSAFPATDFETGVPVGRKPNFPNYGSDAEMQARYILENLSKVMEAAGTSIDQAFKSQFHETDLQNFHDTDQVWASYMGAPPDGLSPTRSSMGMRGFLVPDALFAPNLLFIVPDSKHRKEETQKGIRWHPEAVRKVHFTPGMWVGDWLGLAGQGSVADFADYDSIVRSPAGLPHYWSDIEIQTDFTMVLIREQLTGNGLDFEDIIDARIYLVESARRDYRGFVRAWEKLYEDVSAKPTMSIISSNQTSGVSGMMFEGPVIEIDVIAKKGGK